MEPILRFGDTSVLTGVKNIASHSESDDLLLIAFLLLSTFGYSLHRLLWSKPDPYYHLWFEKPQSTSNTPKTVATRNIGVKLEESNKDIVIFWGSQSGTAEGFAARLARDFKRRFGLEALAADLSDYDPQSIASIPGSKIAIFILSTYGDGDPSDNATNFLSWIEGTQRVEFPNLRYAAFGLGNKRYKFYNRIVDLVTSQLDQLQAHAIMPTGKADDSNGTTEEDFMEWKENLFSVFVTDLNANEVSSQYEASLKVVEDTSLDIVDLHIGEPIAMKDNKKASTAFSPIHPIQIVSARKLLSEKDRNCLHIELDITEHPHLKYTTGDHLALWASNPLHEVECLISILGKQKERSLPLLISALDPQATLKLPSPTSLEALFQYYLEICAPVGREAIQILAQFAPTDSARVTLTQLGSDKEAYHLYCLENHTTLGRLLSAVVAPGVLWSTIPLSLVLEILLPLSPRYYSISSSSIVSPRRIAITVATSTLNSKNQAIPGLATSYLLDFERFKASTGAISLDSKHNFNLNGPNNLLANSSVFAGIRKSKFRLPPVASRPIIMIAAGSGIAPFRAFLHERERLSALGREVGQSLLIFGCRSSSEYLYQDELSQMQESSNGKIKLLVAFSRANVNKKVYVQDLIQENDEHMMKLLLEEEATLYICGSATMARDVTERLGGCLRMKTGWNEGELKDWEGRMKKAKKWQEDVWH